MDEDRPQPAPERPDAVVVRESGKFDGDDVDDLVQEVVGIVA